MTYLLNFIRAVLFYILFVLYALVLMPLFLITFVVIKEVSFICVVGRVWVYGCLYLSRKILKITYDLENFNVIKNMTQPVIIASKHQSMWETFVYAFEFAETSNVVLKKEILRFPIMRSFIKHLNLIVLDRSKTVQSLHQLIKEGKKTKERGFNIVIFPEGTRTKPGEIGPYNEGLYMLYKQLHIPVVTIALNSGLYWTARKFVKNPGHITARVTGIIDPGLNKEEFKKQIYTLIEEPSLELVVRSSN